MPMYDMPELRSALDALWSGLAHHIELEGISSIPDKIVHDRALSDLWSDPCLWFSQCCGYDIVYKYAATLRPIATPHYSAPGCEGYHYTSVVVVSEDADVSDVLDMRGVVCVINGPDSHSGMSALRALVAPVSRNGRFFSKIEVSGTHAASLEMVGRGDADVAAIDCVTYALIERYRPALLAGTRRLGTTDRAPGIPYVTGCREAEETVERMRSALRNTFADPQLADVRQALFLSDIEMLQPSDYRPIVEFQDLATDHGYSELR